MTAACGWARTGWSCGVVTAMPFFGFLLPYCLASWLPYELYVGCEIRFVLQVGSGVEFWIVYLWIIM